MFKSFFLGLLWSISLIGFVVSAFDTTRAMFVGTASELACSLTITFLAMGGFVSIDNHIRKDPF